MSRNGQVLRNPSVAGVMMCSESGLRYKDGEERLRCLDLDEDAALALKLSAGLPPARRFQTVNKGHELCLRTRTCFESGNREKVGGPEWLCAMLAPG